MLVFPDNTVLINFALIRRMDLLGQMVGVNGRWCLTVSQECEASSCQPGHEDLRLARSVFGEPLIPEGKREHLAVQRYRNMLRVAGQPASMNVGEAETLAIIECRGLDALFVTDDGSVRGVAPPGDPHVVGTWDLLRVAHHRGVVDGDELWGYSRVLHAARRHTPPTGPFDRGAFNTWLSG